MKTLKISDSVHEELTRIKGQLIARNGKTKSYSDAIAELIQFWKEKKE